MKSEDVRKLHAVVIPCPAQGHVTPALQLAKKPLALHGLRITFVNTTHVHDRFVKLRNPTSPIHDGIELAAVSHGLPDDHPRLRDLTAFLSAVPLKIGPVLEEFFVNLLKKSAISCIIVDIELTQDLWN